MPATLLTGAPVPAPACQERATASPRSKPSTASVKSLMKLRRRSSPSVKISKPQLLLPGEHAQDVPVLERAQALRVGAPALRASSRSGGRRKLPTWSAR